MLSLQAELSALDNEYDGLVEENQQILNQTDKVKDQNKKIF